MADHLEINSSYYSQLESGKRPISDWVIKRVKLLSERHPASLVNDSQVKLPGGSIIERLHTWGRLHKGLGLEIYTNRELWIAWKFFNKSRRDAPAEAWPIHEFVLNQIVDELQKRGGTPDFVLMKESDVETSGGG